MKNLFTLIALLLIVGVQVSCTHCDNIVSSYRYKRAMRLLQNKHGYDDQTAVMKSVPKLIEQEEYQLALEILNTYEQIDDYYEPIYRYRLLAYNALGETQKAIDDAIKYYDMSDVKFNDDIIQEIFQKDLSYTMTKTNQKIQSSSNDNETKGKHKSIYWEMLRENLFTYALRNDDEQAIELYKETLAQEKDLSINIDYIMAKWYASVGLYDRAIIDIMKYIEATNGKDKQANFDLEVFKRMKELTPDFENFSL